VQALTAKAMASPTPTLNILAHEERLDLKPQAGVICRVECMIWEVDISGR
jgi:hypothetical protein